jgi:hypothetical protein
MKKSTPATISKLPRDAILSVTKSLLGVAMRRLASGQDVTQENIAIVNRARKAVAKAEGR